MLLHATTVLVDGLGVLIRGPEGRHSSGSGKSDLALRLIDGGAKLVADDQSDVQLENGQVVARAPAALAGLLEVRGLGIMNVGAAQGTPIAAVLGLVVDLVEPGEVERLPQPAGTEILGISLPLLRLAPFEASAAAKLRLAVKAVKTGIIHPPHP